MTPIPPRPSMLARIFDDLLRQSRRSGERLHAGLSGGAQLSVLVADGWVRASIWRKGVTVGDVEQATFCKHARVPDDALLVTGPEQATREIDGDTWYCVSYSWEDRDG